jgi:predicted enzyme related to lactoylglutathione lyase
MTNPRFFLGLRTVIYSAPDLTRAKEWYSKMLGIEPYFDQPYYVGFNVGGYELGLDPNGKHTGPGGSVAWWGVADIGEAMAHMKASGAEPVEDAHDVGGGIKVGTVADPFGNIVGLIENPHFDPSATT